MTIDRFIEELKRVKAIWWLDPIDHCIRCRVKGEKHCPISAVAGNSAYFDEPFDGAASLDMSEADAALIVDAADYDDLDTTGLRGRLLEATGLKEAA